MRIAACYEMADNPLWSDPFSAIPLFCGGYAWFPYKGIGEICCLKLGLDGSSAISSWKLAPGTGNLHPGKWVTFVWDGRAVVNCGDVILDLQSMRPIELSEKVKREHSAGQVLDTMEDVSLRRYILRYKNSRTIQCLKDETLLWEIKHKGYRYTSFKETDGCVIFGTAGGHGGGVYCVRLTDGECLCSVDTKGTPRICWQNDRLLSRGRGGELLWIDPFQGKIMDSMCFPAKLNDDSGIYADERYICTVAFREKKDRRLPCFYIVDTWQK